MRHLAGQRMQVFAAVCAAVLALQPLGGALHAAFEEHRWCALHEHLVHAHHADEGEPTSDAHGISAAASRVEAPSSCLAVGGARDGRMPLTAVVLAPSSVRCRPAAHTGRRSRVCDVLSRAPKQGPPAARI